MSVNRLVGLGFQRGSDKREHRCDAGSGHDRAVVAGAVGAQRGGEVSQRRQDVHDVAGVQPADGKAGEDTALDLPDSDPYDSAFAQFAGGGADRVRAADLGPAVGREAPYRQMLAGLEVEHLA